MFVRDRSSRLEGLLLWLQNNAASGPKLPLGQFFGSTANHINWGGNWSIYVSNFSRDNWRTCQAHLRLFSGFLLFPGSCLKYPVLKKMYNDSKP